MSEADLPIDDDSLLGELGDALRDASPDDAPPAPDLPGYEIDREISRGGQGVVYLAYHPQTKRRVAIKTLLKRSLATPKQAARFEREVELVAALRHPGIVTLYDSGVNDDGTPFLVMEFVEGERVDRALRSARDSGNRDKIVRVMIEVCEAVGAAHLRGIIHRDLKPSNVLMDTDGRPRVVDFGLAREAEAAPQSEGVTIEGEFVGTLYYSTPEQVSSGERAVDVRTDVYALGLMLYELLLGRLPYSTGDSLSELIKAIAEEEPQRPRRIEPEFPMDLEAVLLKSLEKEQDKRYATALDFADDLRATLEGLPVTARQHDRWYLFRKSLWRYRYAVGAAAVFVLMVTVFGVAMAVLYVQAETARKNELAARENEERINGAIVESVSAVNRETSDARISTVTEFLDEISGIMDESLATQEARLADVRLALGRAYLGRAEAAKALERFERSLALLRASAEPDPFKIADAERELARANYALGEYAEAERLHRGALAGFESVDGVESAEAAESRLLLGATLLKMRRAEEAEIEIRRSLAVRRSIFGDDSVPVANSLNSLARCLAMQRRDAEASEAAAEAVQRLENSGADEDNWRIAAALRNAARYLTEQPKGDDEPFAAVLDRYDRAAEMLGRALEIDRSWEGAEGRSVAGTLRPLLNLEMRRGNTMRLAGEDPSESFARGAAYGEQLITAMLARYGESHPDTAEAFSERGALFMTSAAFERAAEDFERALSIYNRLYPADHELVGWTEVLVGAAYTRLRRFEEAERLLISGRDKVVEALGPEHVRSRTVEFRVQRSRAYREAVENVPSGDAG